MMTIRFALSVLCATALLAHSPVAAAHEASEETSAAERFESLLRAIDVVPPSAEAFLRAFPDAQARLSAAAEDGARDAWTRQRAVTLLSFFPDAGTRAVLVRLARASDTELRALSVYTLGRAFGDQSGPQADPVIRSLEVALDDTDPSVRDKAVRALRWTRDPRAEGLLDKAATRAELKGLVDATRRKRALRLRPQELKP